MVQAIKDFGEGLRKGLGIVVRCGHCGKQATFPCRDFEGHIAPGEDIERRKWRCTWCGTPATWARYTLIDHMQRQDLAQWIPPKGRKRKWPSR